MACSSTLRPSTFADPTCSGGGELHDDTRPRLMVGGLCIIFCMSEYDVELSYGMHVVHDGPWKAPPLLLIHGSGASGGSWSPMVPALAGHYHVIRVDLPGCGRSPPPRSYDVPVQAGRVADPLDGLGLRRVAVAGHSSGGYLATALAEQRPDLVRSLALISSGPSPDALLEEAGARGGSGQPRRSSHPRRGTDAPGCRTRVTTARGPRSGAELRTQPASGPQVGADDRLVLVQVVSQHHRDSRVRLSRFASGMDQQEEGVAEEPAGVAAVARSGIRRTAITSRPGSRRKPTGGASRKLVLALLRMPSSLKVPETRPRRAATCRDNGHDEYRPQYSAHKQADLAEQLRLP
jgi:pimeloyl-ACP methyl ester carboxylesterase